MKRTFFLVHFVRIIRIQRGSWNAINCRLNKLFEFMVSLFVFVALTNKNDTWCNIKQVLSTPTYLIADAARANQLYQMITMLKLSYCIPSYFSTFESENIKGIRVRFEGSSFCFCFVLFCFLFLYLFCFVFCLPWT